MKMTKVESSNLDEIGYDPETKTLRVKFKSGATHDYTEVPPEVHSGLMAADSCGSYFHQNIRTGGYANKPAGEVSPQNDGDLDQTAVWDLEKAIRRFGAGSKS